MYQKINYKIRFRMLRSLLGVLLIAVAAACDKSSPTDEEVDPPKGAGTLVSLSIKALPAKTHYYIGDPFAADGLVVAGHYDNGESYPLSVSKLTVTGFNSEKSAPQQVLKVGYEGLTVDLTVEIYPFKVIGGNEITEYVDNASSVIIPSGLTKIAEETFVNKQLSSITFPETLQEIGDYAFFFCTQLKSVTLPPSLQILGNGAFDACSSLVTADLSKTAVTVLNEYSFNRCPQLVEVALPVGITKVGALAFTGAKSLKQINLPETTRFIDLDAFRESGLEKISLPNNIKVIRQRAFLSCHSLSEVTTFGSYTPVDDGLVPILEASSFRDVPALTKFEIPQGISYLDQTIMSDCPLLTELTVPLSVKRIKFYAFINTTITRVIIRSDTPAEATPSSIGSVWQAFPSTATIEVPVAALDAYKQANGWSSYVGKLIGY